MKKDSQFLERLYSKQQAADRNFYRSRELFSETQQANLLLSALAHLLHEDTKSLVSLRRSGYSHTERFYHQVVARDLLLQSQIRGGMELPLPPKVVLNTTSKRFAANRRELIVGLATLLLVSGQRGEPTIARKSVAAFKLREGTPLGCKVTLRGARGYSLLDKLVTFVLPRGHPSRVRGTVDGAGNWGVGVSDPLLFIELEGQYELFRSLEGIDASIVTDKPSRPIALLLFSGLQLLT